MGALVYCLLGFIFLQAFILKNVECCSGLSSQYGNMTEDYDLEVGDALKVQCTLFSNVIKVNETSYNVTSENLRLKFRNAFIQNYDIVDEYTVEYAVDSATINDTGYYNCYLSIPQLGFNPFVCSSYIAVGYKPLPVQNFSCVSLEFSNLTCSWDMPFNPVKTKYELWDYFRVERLRRKCPIILNSRSCQYRLDTKPVYLQSPKTLYFLLVGNNSLGSKKQYITIEHFKIVKPGVPTSITFLNVTRRNLVIHLSPPKGMEYGQFPPGLQYSILYHPISAPRSTAKEQRVFSRDSSFVGVEDLVPHTEYKFEIRCRSNDSDSDLLWSPTVVLTMGTLSDVPYLAPPVANSSFDVETILGNRTITLYWKAIPSEYENGDEFHYMIEYHVHHVPSRTARDNSVVNVGNKTYHSFMHMDVNSAYMFNIYAANSEGPSMNSSQIIVDKAEKLLDVPKSFTVLSYGQGNYTLSWKAPDAKVTHYTLYWCQSLIPRPVKCRGSLEWVHTYNTEHNLLLSDTSTNYQFAVTANYDRQTSGMSWASCIVSYSGVLYKVEKVELTPKNSTSLKVQWSLDCDAQKTVIKEYRIHYCQLETTCNRRYYDIQYCQDWKTERVTDIRQDEHLLGSLKPYTCYLAFMQVHTVSGWSENSNLAYESTMSSAPSDPPRDVKVLGVNETIIYVSFRPPNTPNGVITRYIIYYNKTSAYDASHHKEVRAQQFGDHVYKVEITNSVFYFSNYSIEVKACVDQACSEASRPVYAFTGISKPGMMKSPRVEIIDTHINITWEPPTLPNGPVNFYQIIKERNETESEFFNVTGQHYLVLNQVCDKTSGDKLIYNFKVRAVNIRDGVPLHGIYSEPTKTTLCPGAVGITMLIAGSVLGASALLIVLYCFSSWLWKKYHEVKRTIIELPKGLESSENPLNSYDKFKKGLTNSHDAGIPCDRAYERLCSFASEGNIKEMGNGYAITEEHSQKLKRDSTGRNNSGESNTSAKCHDSISSSNTAKTHLSIDSGAETDSPPSPDGFFSDTSSSNTTPRSYKPDLNIVKENTLSSKDSGLEKDSRNGDIPSKFSYYVRKKTGPYSNIQVHKCNGQMPGYSKFAVLGATNVPRTPYGEQNLGLLENHSLSNSEPSVADFDACSGSIPLVLPGIQPYSKFGLARSAGTGINMANQPLAVNANGGYSKYGTVYRALKCQDNGSRDSCLNSSGMKAHLMFLPFQPHVLAALSLPNSHLTSSVHQRPKNLSKECSATASDDKKQNLQKPGRNLIKEDLSNAYSKFGISAENNNRANNGYVSYDAAKSQSTLFPVSSEINAPVTEPKNDLELYLPEEEQSEEDFAAGIFSPRTAFSINELANTNYNLGGNMTNKDSIAYSKFGISEPIPSSKENFCSGYVSYDSLKKESDMSNVTSANGHENSESEESKSASELDTELFSPQILDDCEEICVKNQIHDYIPHETGDKFKPEDPLVDDVELERKTIDHIAAESESLNVCDELNVLEHLNGEQDVDDVPAAMCNGYCHTERPQPRKMSSGYMPWTELAKDCHITSQPNLTSFPTDGV